MFKTESLRLSHKSQTAEQDLTATATSRSIFTSKFELSTSPSKVTEFSPRFRFPNTENDFDLDREPRWAFEGERLHYFNGKAKPLKVLVVTWNIFGKKPGEVVEELLNTQNSQHHLIAIATQECLRPIGMSFFNNSKDEWVEMLKKYLPEFELITDHTLNAIHLAVFARKEVCNFVKEVESAEIATGFANFLGNKGAVGISFKILGNSFLFLSCHLTCGQAAVDRRNDDFARVMENMPLPWYRLEQHLPEEQKAITEHFDFIFCAGDLNYRIDMQQPETLSCYEQKDFKALLDKDQLNAEKINKKDLFKKFHEGEIRFAPTYKYELTTHALDATKERRPAWTDRILYAYKEKDVKVELQNYDSNRLIFGSDHRPVFAQFVVGLDFSEKKVGAINLVKC